MRTIITTAIALTIATTASASWNNTGDVRWNGNTGNLHADGCSFKNQTNGTMTLDADTGKWTTTVAASIKVKSKNKNNIKVTSDNKLRKTGSELGTATVNYNGGGVASAIVTNNASAVKNINNSAIQLGNANKTGATVTTFTIGGTAQMADLDDLADIDNNQAVYINHTVTCLQ